MNLPLYALWCLADVAGLVAEDDEPDRPFTMQTQVVGLALEFMFWWGILANKSAVGGTMVMR